MHNKNGQGKTFYFKQFQIDHDRCAMKVGTDGVLLGAWCRINHARRILDIGAGSGLIALMLAQRTNSDVMIDAVESDYESWLQCCRNFERSPWSSRLRAIHTRVQDFKSENQYDLIVSNPPYFKSGYTSANPQRNSARHGISLNFSDLIASMRILLDSSGHIGIILPNDEGTRFIMEMAKHSLFCTAIVEVKSKNNFPVERVLLEFGRESKVRETDTLILHDRNGLRTTSYQELVEEFYIK